MGSKLMLIALLCVYSSCYSQAVLNGEVRSQKPTSFYSRSHATNDELIAKEKYALQPTRDIKSKNFNNPPNAIVQNLNNPKGTIVLEGNRSVEELKAIIADPEKLVINGNFTEVSYVSNNLLFKIPTYNVSRHFEVTDPAVSTELTYFVNNYIKRTNEVPGSVELSHNNTIQACKFYGFRSKSNLYSYPLYSERLNLSCVFNHSFDNSLCLLIHTNEKYPTH